MMTEDASAHQRYWKEVRVISKEGESSVLEKLYINAS